MKLSHLILGGLVLSLLPIWRGGQYSRNNGINVWKAIQEVMIRTGNEETHIPVVEAISRAREAHQSYLSR